MAAARGARRPQAAVYLTRTDGQPLALAGLYETWTDPQGEQLLTCVVLTTTAVDELGHLHDRAPVVVEPADWAAWLDPVQRDPTDLLARLGPLPAYATATWRVPPDVSNVRNNGPQLIRPLPAAAQDLSPASNTRGRS